MSIFDVLLTLVLAAGPQEVVPGTVLEPAPVVQVDEPEAVTEEPADEPEDWNAPPPEGVEHLETGSCEEDFTCPEGLHGSEVGKAGLTAVEIEPEGMSDLLGGGE